MEIRRVSNGLPNPFIAISNKLLSEVFNLLLLFSRGYFLIFQRHGAINTHNVLLRYSHSSVEQDIGNWLSRNQDIGNITIHRIG